ncbi:hypothetical protein [Aurantibacter sp.]|uniref:hypothetical protein n=1 Tax=Aurantibacter sp. TaxID=2807103 RepID=UPI0035C7A9FE
MKINKIKIGAFLLLGSILINSCSEDDVAGMDNRTEKPTATTTVTSLDLTEGEMATIPFTIDQPINKVAQFKIEVVNSTRSTDDLIAGDQDTDADTGVPGEGFEITVPAFATSFDIPVQALFDFDKTEGTEEVVLKISAAGIRTILTPKPYIVRVSIADLSFCTWTLSMTDDYGDGWSGAYISLDNGGTETQYLNEDLDGVFGYIVETQEYEIAIYEGFDFEFYYHAGDGAGGPPGWDVENTYVLTAPDGTVYADGPIPADGIITNGTGVACN